MTTTFAILIALGKKIGVEDIIIFGSKTEDVDIAEGGNHRGNSLLL